MSGNERNTVTQIPVPNDCACPACRAACQTVPGTALPDDMPKIAAFLGMEQSDVEAGWFERDFMTGGMRPQMHTTVMGYRACRFYSADGRCSIHSVKPYECKMAHHSNGPNEIETIVGNLIKAWSGHAR